MGFKLTTKLIIAAIILIILIILGLSSGIINFNVLKTTSESNQQLVLKKIEEVGNLELVKFNFNDIIEESVVRKIFDIDNLAPDSRVLVIVNGEAIACINLKKVTKDDIKIIGDNVNISLPEPMICYTKINHERSRIYDQNFAAKIFNPELIDKAYQDGELKIKDEAIKLGIIDQAKVNAKKLLGALLNGIIKKDIVINFNKTTD